LVPVSQPVVPVDSSRLRSSALRSTLSGTKHRRPATKRAVLLYS